jgi:carbon storage regulator
MLVLTRKENQSVVIDGGQITLTILRIRGNQISLGIQAPKEVSVLRAELNCLGPAPVALEAGQETAGAASVLPGSTFSENLLPSL